MKWQLHLFCTEGAIFLVYSAVQSQKAVSADFRSEQILPFGFAELRMNTASNKAHASPMLANGEPG